MHGETTKPGTGLLAFSVHAFTAAEPKTNTVAVTCLE